MHFKNKNKCVKSFYLTDISAKLFSSYLQNKYHKIYVQS